MIELQQTWMLPALIAIPFIAGLLCWLVERHNKRLPRWIALIGMILTFGLSLVLWQYGNFNGMSDRVLDPQASAPWFAEFSVPWIPRLGISFHLAMDGMSLLMVALTGLLGVAAVACSWNEIQRRVGFFHLNLLWSLGGVIGVFMAIDMFLFFFFWEMMLVPIYFLIAIWGHDVVGGKTKEYAATKFFIYTQLSGLIMLIGILLLVLFSQAQTGRYSFNYNDLLGTSMGGWEYPIMLCFFIGFAVKLPIIPFHGWLPDAHAQAPTAGSVDLAGVLIKTAAYGLIRFVLPLFPAASQEFAPIAMTLGTIGIFYGAWLAFMQTDMKRLLAYTSISHMGFIVLAIYAGTLLSLQGLMVQMLAHGLSSAALFIMAGQLYERLHTRDITVMGGMWGQFRYYAPLLMFFCAALLGIPGTGNFIGEFMILFGSFAQYPVFVVFATFSLVLAGLYSLLLVYRALFGANTTKEVARRETKDHGLPERRLKDLGRREISLLLVLAVGLVWLGLYPQPILDTSSHAMQWINNAYIYSEITQVDASQLLDAMEAR
ncbi:NADH-quinone oxidoreductase subunit M [Psychrobacter sp. M13]|uniref:NADH-quinone oxidoreductase subunit M n=1 Tax=Psychrobacter sp. M13 TaxID=3067275 RepID=UPI00273B579F|nr:NADH-quinone oxidoreductase subunit M [Psychrobacter sp. M13]WLP95189.1 NADH-quinone oxidoreductase subunit M [Psychrobacter sp. M13]